jgi:hypothetical protein
VLRESIDRRKCSEQRLRHFARICRVRKLVHAAYSLWSREHELLENWLTSPTHTHSTNGGGLLIFARCASRYTVNLGVPLPGTTQTSLRRLRPVPPEFDALFAAARTWDTLTSQAYRCRCRRCQRLGIFAEDWMSGYSSERRSSFH